MTAKFYGVRKYRAEYDELAQKFQRNYADIIGNDDYFFSDEDYEFDSFNVFDKKVKNNLQLKEKWDAKKLALSEELLLYKQIVDTLSKLELDSGVAYKELLTIYFDCYYAIDEKSEKLRVRQALERVLYNIVKSSVDFRRFLDLTRLAFHSSKNWNCEKRFKAQIVKTTIHSVNGNNTEF